MQRLIRRFLAWFFGLSFIRGLRRSFQPGDSAALPAQGAGPIDLPDSIEAELGLGAAVAPVYRRSDSLFSYRERRFWLALRQEVGAEYALFAKVRLADLIWIANEPINKKLYNAELLRKHVDFVVCNRETFHPLLAIELDDSSHRRYDNTERDAYKDRVCAAVRLPLWRVKVQQEYDRGMISRTIHGLIATQGSDDAAAATANQSEKVDRD
jgi:hypothetical protein